MLCFRCSALSVNCASHESHLRKREQNEMELTQSQTGEFIHTVNITATITRLSLETWTQLLQVYLAYGVPYTTRDLRHDLAEAKVMAAGLPGGTVCMERSMLCATVGGLPLETVTLWDSAPNTVPCDERPVAVISSRVHPGHCLPHCHHLSHSSSTMPLYTLTLTHSLSLVLVVMM